MPKTTVEIRDGFKTTISSRDHVYHADEPAADGGSDAGPKPSEMLLGALGSCVAITLKMYAGRKGWPLEGVKIELDFERFRADEYDDYDGDQAFIHEFREGITLLGPLDDEQKARLMNIATKCPVRRAVELPAIFKDTAEG
jgi:putative redox protein